MPAASDGASYDNASLLGALRPLGPTWRSMRLAQLADDAGPDRWSRGLRIGFSNMPCMTRCTMSRMSSAGSLVCATSDDRESSGRAIGDLRHCAAGGHRPRLGIARVRASIKGVSRGLASQTIGPHRVGCNFRAPPRNSRVPARSRGSRDVHAGPEPSCALAGHLPHLRREDGRALVDKVTQLGRFGAGADSGEESV
jgi:hypothetical protein